MAGLDNRKVLLIRFAEESEDAADGLYKFRESLPRNATRITAIVAELFAISSALRAIHNEEGTRQYGPSFYRIQEDLALVFRSLGLTLAELFNMFARARERPDQMVWEDCNYRFEQEEQFGLLERLEWYREFLDAQRDILDGTPVESLRVLRQDLKDVLQAQETARRQSHRPSMSGASTPRPRPRRPSRPAPYPMSPTMSSSDHDSWESWDRPPNMGPAPEPPISPMSPIFSDSSRTFSSSQTSYSSETYIPTTPVPLIHWSENIFDGRHPTTPYRQQFQAMERTSCHGSADPVSLQHLVRDGFQPAVQLSFDEERFLVRLYWRPSDFRARILLMTTDMHGQQLHFCQPLTTLKVIRKGSTLQLCRARRGDGRYSLWARLNFMFHERMVLFYSTFVAMKRQDQRGVAHGELVDTLELIGDSGEQELFAGQMKHGEMFHALRLFRDNASGAVRLEASALRGSKKDVPIWTAFVTKYAYDPDWAHFEGNGVVSLIAIRPPPYVFILRYEPPKNALGAYVLPFTTDEGKSYHTHLVSRLIDTDRICRC